MTSLILALLFMALSWLSLSARNKNIFRGLSFAFALFLFVWLNQNADLLSLGRDEEGLLIWVAVALLLILLLRGEIFLRDQTQLHFYFLPLAALSFAMALDFLHPDAYGLMPAAIVATMLLLLSLRILQRLGQGAHAPALWIKLLSLFPHALLLYAAYYKLFDRNWFLPWSYMMAAGASLFVLSQLWTAWRTVGLTKETWFRRIAMAQDLALVLIVVSALYHYAQYF